mmetsp:Transcript_16858/g.45664  ORF Transcript_16858/g.45664 Transcript_16858/m.45664 type:complete len:235 (-) Transcript_16858:448-1152(-)
MLDSTGEEGTHKKGVSTAFGVTPSGHPARLSQSSKGEGGGENFLHTAGKQRCGSSPVTAAFGVAPSYHRAVHLQRCESSHRGVHTLDVCCQACLYGRAVSTKARVAPRDNRTRGLDSCKGRSGGIHVTHIHQCEVQRSAVSTFLRQTPSNHRLVRSQRCESGASRGNMMDSVPQVLLDGTAVTTERMRSPRDDAPVLRHGHERSFVSKDLPHTSELVLHRTDVATSKRVTPSNN